MINFGYITINFLVKLLHRLYGILIMNEILHCAVTEPVQWSFGLDPKVFVLVLKKVLFTSHVKLQWKAPQKYKTMQWTHYSTYGNQITHYSNCCSVSKLCLNSMSGCQRRSDKLSDTEHIFRSDINVFRLLQFESFDSITALLVWCHLQTHHWISVSPHLKQHAIYNEISSIKFNTERTQC